MKRKLCTVAWCCVGLCALWDCAWCYVSKEGDTVLEVKCVCVEGLGLGFGWCILCVSYKMSLFFSFL